MPATTADPHPPSSALTTADDYEWPAKAAIWAVATLPMCGLAWWAIPWLIARSPLAPASWYWLAMTFFAPIPWEAEKFYANPGMAAYAASGLCAAIASALCTAQLETASPVLKQKELLDIVGAAVIGGTSLFGGRGGVVATACPFCLTMMKDGVADAGLEESIKVLDVAEIVAAGLDRRGSDEA